MRKIPGTLYQIEIRSPKQEIYNLSMWYRDDLITERSNLTKKGIMSVIEAVFEENDLIIPRNRLEMVIDQEMKNLSTKKTISFVESTVSEMLNEFEKKPADEMKKIVLIGLSNAGKTCIYERIFEGKKPWELMHSSATKGISYKEYSVGEVSKPMIWDLGGQQQYLDEYHGPLKSSIFKKASILLYVIDVSDVERFDLAVEEFKWATDQILSHNSSVQLNVFFHKIDTIHNKDEVIKYLKQRFSQNISHKINFHPTSIFDESLFKAWSDIIRQMSPKSTFINSILNQLKKQEGVENVLLLESSTGLACGTTMEGDEEDLIIGMFSLLMVTIDKFTKNLSIAKFKEFRLQTENNYVLLTDVTPDLILAIIVDTSTFKQDTLKDITNKGKEITQQIRKLWVN